MPCLLLPFWRLIGCGTRWSTSGTQARVGLQESVGTTSAGVPGPLRVVGSWYNEAGFVGGDDKLGAVTQPQLGQNPAHMRLRGQRAEHQPFADFGVGQATCHQREHLGFAGREPIGDPLVRASPPGSGCELGDQPAGYLRCDQRPAVGDDPDGRQQLLGCAVFQQKPGRAGPQRRVDVFVEIEGGQHNDPHVGRHRVRDNPPGGRQTVQDRHPDVHQQHIRPLLPRQHDRLLTIRGLADELQIRVKRDLHTQPVPNDGLIIGNTDPDPHRTSRRRWSALASRPPSRPARIGKLARTCQPGPSGRGPAHNVPPAAATRSRMPSSPCPSGAGAPTPASSTVTTSWSLTATATCAASDPECRNALVNASCTIRYTTSTTCGGTAPRRSSNLASTTNPALRAASANPTTSAAVTCSGRSRNTPTSHRTSRNTLRPARSILSNARPTSASAPACNAIRPAPACTVIAPIPCPTTSCRSRAIRSRSATTADSVIASSRARRATTNTPASTANTSTTAYVAASPAAPTNTTQTATTAPAKSRATGPHSTGPKRAAT